MTNIHDTRIWVYHGHETQPDGTEYNYAFATAWFCGDSPVYGEFMFYVDDNDELIPTHPLGNAAEYDYCEEFINLCAARLNSPAIE